MYKAVCIILLIGSLLSAEASLIVDENLGAMFFPAVGVVLWGLAGGLWYFSRIRTRWLRLPLVVISSLAIAVTILMLWGDATGTTSEGLFGTVHDVSRSSRVLSGVALASFVLGEGMLIGSVLSRESGY